MWLAAGRRTCGLKRGREGGGEGSTDRAGRAGTEAGSKKPIEGWSRREEQPLTKEKRRVGKRTLKKNPWEQGPLGFQGSKGKGTRMPEN